MKALPAFITLLSFGLLGIFVYSCSQKSDLIDQETVSAKNITLRSGGFTDPPQLNGDRLEFRDVEHFTEYYEQLDALFDEDSEEFDSLIEEYDEVNSVYVKILNDEFDDPEEAYDPFLSDPIMQAIVNEYFEFQVDDILVTYINNEEILTCDESDTYTQGLIRAMAKGDRIDTASIPDDAFWGPDTDIESIAPPWCRCMIYAEYEDCNTIRIYGSCSGYLWGAGAGVVRIWRRTTPGVPTSGTPAFQTHGVNGNFEFFVDLTFAQDPLWIVTQADPICPTANNRDVSIYFDPEGTVCDLGERNTNWQWEELNGQAFRYKTSYYSHFFGSYELAEMESRYWHQGEAEWKKGQAKLTATIEAFRRNDDCDQFFYDDETKDCNNCRTEKARINHGVYRFIGHCDGDVVGTYEKEIDNFIIDASHSIDFECCL